MTGRDADLLRRIDELERQQRELVAIKDMGKGVLWAVFKIGAVGLAVAGLAIAVWKILHEP